MPFGLGDIGDTLLRISGIGEDKSEAPSFIIEELTGTKTRIELRGRSLPYRPVGFGAEMRTVKTNYPGNPNATQQVLGPDFINTVIRGMWKDRFIVSQSGDSEVLINNSPSEIDTAEKMVVLMYEILQGGNTLRVQWGTEVRTGIMVSFVPSWERLQDVEWEMEFEWSSKDDKQPTRAAQLPEGADALRTFMNDLDDTLALLESLEDVSRAYTAQIITAIQSVREQVGRVFSILRTINNLVSLPATLLGALESAINSIRLELSDEISRLSDTAITQAALTTRVADVARIEAQRREVSKTAQALRASNLRIAEQRRAEFAPPPIRVVTTLEETTAYQLSVQFYGTPDFANFILKANRRKSVLLPAGLQINIPPRPSQTAGNDLGEDCGC